MMVLFALQKRFIFMRFHYQFLSSVPVLTIFCVESPFLCQWGQTYSQFSLLTKSGYLALCWGPWSIWSWVLCRVISMDLISILLHAYIRYDQHHLLKTLFSSMYYWLLYRTLGVYRCGFMSGSLIPFHWLTFLLLCQYHAVFITIAL